MAKQSPIITQDDVYAARIFLYSALPLLRVIAESEEKYGKKFAGKSFVFQVSAKYSEAEGGAMGTHFVVENGNWTVNVGKLHENPDVEFIFPNLRDFNIFFSGKGMPLPKIKGWGKLGILVSILMTLLRMAGLLQCKDVPQKLEDQIMLVKLYFYLLPSGISQLNKLGYPEFKAFTKKLSLKFFINYNEKLLIAIKDFCLIRKCDCEGDLEKIDERLMEIGHKVFKELPNPKEDMRYIKKKQLNQVQRDYIYESFDEKYGINEIQK